jgi:hypothetical protein
MTKGDRKKAKETGAEPGSGARQRKERVLHTRISDELAKDIMRVADDLRVPVSNLVRNVLEDVFSIAESVTDNVGNLIGDVLEQAERTREKLRRQADEALGPGTARPRSAATAAPERAAVDDVLAWQPVIVNQAQACARCGAEIARGNRAAIGLTAGGLTQTYLCTTCMDASVSEG